MTTQGNQEPFKPISQMTWFVLFMLTAAQLIPYHWEVFLLSFMLKMAHYLGVNKRGLFSNLVSRLAGRITVNHEYSCRLQNQTCWIVKCFYTHHASRTKSNWCCQSENPWLWYALWLKVTLTLMFSFNSGQKSWPDHPVIIAQFQDR